MNKTEILLLTTLMIPLLNCLAVRIYQNSTKALDFLTTAVPILFLVSLIGLQRSYVYQDYNNIDLIKAYLNLSISFSLDWASINFLFLLSFIWLIFSFYLRRFLQINQEIKAENQSKSLFLAFEFQMLFAILIALINLIILAKNLVTILFFFNCLIIWYHFSITNFLSQSPSKNKSKKKISPTNISSATICNFILYLQSILLFFAIIITHKFSPNLEFNSKISILTNLANYHPVEYLTLFLLYFASLFLLSLFGAYLLYRNINLNAIEVFVFFALGFGFVQLFVFYKLLTQIFGIELFSTIVKIIGSEYFYYVFSFNILVTAILAIFSHNLKSSFFYLLFNQLSSALFTIFIFSEAGSNKVFAITTNFILSQLLLFLSLSNIVIFLKQSKSKEITGLFFKLKITIILMIFTFLNIIGIAPTLGIAEKILLIKILFQQQFSLPVIIFACNQLLLIIFAIRLFYPMFLNDSQNNNQKEREISLAKDTDLDSNLILPPSMIALALILLLFFMPS
jgi:formate hydrogenlyase subunit 3/multisubunit Na+/H+ antiporter MnhD subunit